MNFFIYADVILLICICKDSFVFYLLCMSDQNIPVRALP